MTTGAGAVRLEERKRPLALLVEGLLGRAVPVVSDPADAGADAVVLPESIGTFGSRRDNAAAYRVAVLRRVASEQYGRGRALAAEGSELVRLVDAVESLRIDRMLVRGYPGAERDVAMVRAQTFRELDEVPAGRVRDRVVGLVERLAVVDEPLAAGLPSGPLVRDLRALLGRVEATDADARTSLAVADAIVAWLDEVDPVALPPSSLTAAAVDSAVDDDVDPEDVLEDEEDRREDPFVFDLPFGPTVLPEDVLPEGADGREGGGTLDEQQRIEVPVPKRRMDLPSEPAEREPAQRGGPDPSTPQRAPDGARTFHYDEWDYHQRAYLRGWCTLYERRLEGDDLDFLVGVRRKHGAVVTQVRRWFSFTRPQAWQRVRRVDDGDELDLDVIVERRVDRRAGHAGDDRHHVRRDRLRRDVAVAFLVDMSSSTSTPVKPPPLVSAVSGVVSSDPDDDVDLYLRGSRGWWEDDEAPPPPPGDTVLDVSKAAMAIVGDGLSHLGDSYAIYGFSGRGRSNVEFHVGKEFGDRPTGRTWAAVSAMKPLGYTRMGPAIRHATSKLVDQPETAKLLVVVSDGYPQDQDYGPDWRDHDYGLHDTSKALEEAARAGVATFCITVDPAGHDYLRRMCAPDRYLVIDDVAALPRELARVYRTLSSLAAG